MANLYLMQALYAPKPPRSTPSPGVSALDDGVQRRQGQSATPEQAIRGERLRMMEIEGKNPKKLFSTLLTHSRTT